MTVLSTASKLYANILKYNLNKHIATILGSFRKGRCHIHTSISYRKRKRIQSSNLYFIHRLWEDVWQFISGKVMKYCYKRNCTSTFNKVHVIWVPLTTAWRILELRKEETDSRYGGQLRIYWISSRGQLTRTGPQAWMLGEGLTTLPSKKKKKKKKQLVTKCYTGPRDWMESLERPKQRKMDVRLRTWNVTSLYRAGSLKIVWSELAKRTLDLVAVQDVRQVKGGSQPAVEYTSTLFHGYWNANHHSGTN
jgi:hypothetical protein